MSRTEKTTTPVQAAPSRKSQFPHIEYRDIYDDGTYHEIAVVKDRADGSYDYIIINQLDDMDKGRIKKIITGQYTRMSELWELMANESLSNGMNALDYFHQLVRKKLAPGTVQKSNSGLGLESVAVTPSSLIGSGYANPKEGNIIG